MAFQKSTYYRVWVDGDGITRVKTAVFPSDGEWAATYAGRGWSLTPPPDYDPEAVEPEEADDGPVGVAGDKKAAAAKN